MKTLDGKSILVTGGTGSFGTMLVKRLLDQSNARRVIVFSRDELKQSEMEQRFSAHPRYGVLRFFLGDVRDLDRLLMALRGVDFVVHAAAQKQIVAAEYNPIECIKTNVLGAENVVQACIRTGVTQAIALSTDKAVNPINLYGASKLASDKIFIAANNLSGADGTDFGIVRYGNVVSSRGSVVPLFRRLIDSGADHLPITDERMTRFWITLDQGVDFVVSCLRGMRPGEIHVPKIPSMRIIDLARAMAPGLPIKTVGIRPGEKLHEVLVSADEARRTVELDDRYIVRPDGFQPDLAEAPANCPWPKVAEGFEYRSDSNSQWIHPDGIRVLVQAA